MTRTLAFGISLEKRSFVAGEPIPLHIWVDNTGEETAGVMTCMGLDNFKQYGFDVYGAYGHRVLSRGNAMALKSFADPLEEACHTDRGRFLLSDRLKVCTRNFPIPIAAHTCVTGDDYDFETDLTGRYDLPPGEYTIRPREDEDADDLCSEAARALWHGTPGQNITFAVTQP
ncbi:MAG: hypothetical protein WBD46_08300 [Acidobacteriaceae bacterium]